MKQVAIRTLPRMAVLVGLVRAAAAVAVAAVVSVGHAGEAFADVIEIRANDGVPGAWEEAAITGEPDVHEFSVDLVTEHIEVRLPRTPVRIERRWVHQLALSEDGPWVDVPGAEQVGAWRTVRPARQWLEDLADSGGALPELNWRSGWTESVDAHLGERWSAIARKCAQVGGSANGCYVYESRRDFRAWFAGESQPMILQLRRPGGR